MSGLLPADSGKIASHVFAGSNVALRTQPWSTYGWPVVHLVVVIVIGREIFMTIFRHAAARRGVVISAIGPAKWKTGFQSVWVGSAYFWFFAATLARTEGWTSAAWFAFANFNGIVGTITMIASVFLTLYSLVLYLRRYAVVFAP